MTWKLWWCLGDGWPEHGRGILSTLQDVQPDVAGLQQVWGTAETAQAHQLAEQLGMHAAFAVASLPPAAPAAQRPDQGRIQVGVAVRSRWPS
jgi:endonuclease/exonuclease/phosphatase family metal-dependent hydrolase